MARSTGGSVPLACVYMIFGYLFFVTGLVSILVRLYWLATIHVLKKLKQLLCRYDRLGACVFGGIVGWLILSGFAHIHNNSVYQLFVPIFIAVFWLIGSKRFIAFFEPMFRKKCIYLDPETKTIRECGLASPAYLGNFFVYLVGCVLGIMRFVFTVIMVFVMMTYISLTVSGLHNDTYCESIAVAKQMGKYCIYVYMGVYILYNIPNYIIDTMDDAASYKAFPMNVLHSIMSVFEKPIRKMADVYKFKVGVYWTPLPLFFINFLGGGKIIEIFHGLIDKGLVKLNNFVGVFRGYACSGSTAAIISMTVEMNTVFSDAISNDDNDDDNASEQTPDDESKPNGLQFSNMDKDDPNKTYFKRCKHIFAKYKQVIRHQSIGNTPVKEKLGKMEDLFDPPKGQNTYQTNKEVLTDIKELYIASDNSKTGLHAFIKNFRESDIAKKYLGDIPPPVEDILSNIFDYQEGIDSATLREEGPLGWLKSKAEYVINFMLRTASCIIIAFMNIFANLIDSYGGINRMKNDVKVSVVAGLACWFACFVMMIIVASKHGKLS